MRQYKLVSEMTPEQHARKLEIDRAYRARHKAVLQQRKRSQYKMQAAQLCRDANFRYKFDPEFVEKTREYNRNRQRMIREGTWVFRKDKKKNA